MNHIKSFCKNNAYNHLRMSLITTLCQKIIAKASTRMYWKYSMRGVSRDWYNMSRCCHSRDTHLSAVFFIHTSIGSALSDIVYFLVVWPEEIFCSARTAANFSEHDISKCLNNLFLVLIGLVLLVLAIYMLRTWSIMLLVELYPKSIAIRWSWITVWVVT